MNELTEKMTELGRKRYAEHIKLFGKEPKIEYVWDAAYYGLISEEECVQRIRETDENYRKADRLCGVIGIPIFALWTIFAIWAFLKTMLLIVFVEGIIPGIIGLALSAKCLKKSLKKVL